MAALHESWCFPLTPVDYLIAPGVFKLFSTSTEYKIDRASREMPTVMGYCQVNPRICDQTAHGGLLLRRTSFSLYHHHRL